MLFVGEAPGFSEDVFGRPFVGKSGKKLKEWIEEAGGGEFVIAFNNMLACKPQDKRRGAIRPPVVPETEACQPRFQEAFEILRPKAIIALGSVANAYLRPILFDADWFDGIVWHLPHPAWVIRSESKAEKKRYVERLTDLFTRLRKERERESTKEAGRIDWEKLSKSVAEAAARSHHR